MARTFTKLGKEIEIAVKAAGPDPSGNTRLRILMQNAKAENMPKENVERAIKRATEKDAADYKEVIYEGYGSHGIAFLVETATDNTNRTVANVRMYFNKCGGTLGNSGSVAFMFDHKCVFKVPPGRRRRYGGARTGDDRSGRGRSSIPKRTVLRFYAPTSRSAPSRNGSTTRGTRSCRESRFTAHRYEGVGCRRPRVDRETRRETRRGRRRDQRLPQHEGGRGG